jgi:hypothetical protein
MAKKSEAEPTEPTEPVEPVGEPTEPTGEDPPVEDPPVEASPAEVANKAAFCELMPALAGSYDDLPPHARESIVLQALQDREKAAQSPQVVDSGEPSPGEDALQALAQITDESVAAAVDKMLDGDSSGVIKLLASLPRALGAHVELVNSALGRQDGQLGEIARPLALTKARTGVPGATDADMALALQKWNAGDTDSPLNAVKLAMLDRLLGERSKPDPNDTRQRRQRGIDASTRAAAGEPTGQPAVPIRGLDDPAFAQKLGEEMKEQGITPS